MNNLKNENIPTKKYVLVNSKSVDSKSISDFFGSYDFIFYKPIELNTMFYKIISDAIRVI